MRGNHPILIVLLAGLLLILASCAAPTATPVTEPDGDGEEVQEPPAESAEPVLLEVLLVDYNDAVQAWLDDEIVPAFEEANPNVDVEIIYGSWGTLDDTIAGYFAAGDGAEILNLGSEYAPLWGDELAPLNAHLAEGWEIDQFIDGPLMTATWEGELRGLPWLTVPRAYMCRTDLLAEAGYESSPTTWEQAIEVAEATTVIESNAVQRAGFYVGSPTPLADWQEFISLIWSQGGELYSDDGTPMFDSPEARAALQFIYDRRRAVVPDETVAELPESEGSRLSFENNEVVCFWGNHWSSGLAYDAPEWESIELTAGPINADDPDSRPVSQVFIDWLAVPAYVEGAELEAAVNFLKVLGTAENMAAYNIAIGSFPPRVDADVPDDKVFVEMAKLMADYGVGFSDIRESAQLRDLLMEQIDLFVTDAQDLDTTIANIQSQYTDTLEEAGYLE